MEALALLQQHQDFHRRARLLACKGSARTADDCAVFLAQMGRAAEALVSGDSQQVAGLLRERWGAVRGVLLRQGEAGLSGEALVALRAAAQAVGV
jgi:hypothetical protein